MHEIKCIFQVFQQHLKCHVYFTTRRKKNSILLINSLQWVNRVSSTILGTDSWPWFCSSVISSLQTFSRTVLTPMCRLSSDITKEKVWQIISTLLFHNSDKLHTRKVTWVPENVYVFFSPEHERAFHVKGYCAHTGINWLWANRNWNEVTVHVEQVSPLCIFSISTSFYLLLKIYLVLFHYH